jgi:hypothetical protein
MNMMHIIRKGQVRWLRDATKPRLFVLIPPAPGLASALQQVSVDSKQNLTIVDGPDQVGQLAATLRRRFRKSGTERSYR